MEANNTNTEQGDSKMLNTTLEAKKKRMWLLINRLANTAYAHTSMQLSDAKEVGFLAEQIVVLREAKDMCEKHRYSMTKETTE